MEMVKKVGLTATAFEEPDYTEQLETYTDTELIEEAKAAIDALIGSAADFEQWDSLIEVWHILELLERHAEGEEGA